jgi:hypothetical protein
MALGERQYHTLVASLPYLPRFDRAKILPISIERLRARGSMLAPEDAAVLDQALTYFAYERQPVDRTDTQIVAFYHDIMSKTDQPTLRAIIDFTVSQRTIMAALRRRHRGLPVPSAGEPWGAGRWVRHIERNWSDANFNLAGVYPWIPECRQLLESEQPLALEKRLMDLSWDYVDRLADGKYFTFDVVLIYVCKWELVNQWLSYDERAAATRFEQLLTEVIGEHKRIFN